MSVTLLLVLVQVSFSLMGVVAFIQERNINHDQFDWISFGLFFISPCEDHESNCSCEETVIILQYCEIKGKI